MQTLHIGNKNYSSWSLRPWLLMKVLDIPFVEVIHRFGDAQDWAAYRSINPSALVPSLIEGDAVIWDSLAIIEYLAEDCDTVWPKDKVARAWARCTTAEMHSGFGALRNQCSMNCGVKVAMHQVDAALQRDIERIDTLWQQGLSTFGGPFLAGQQFTAVDAFYAPVVSRLTTYGLPVSDLSQAYVARILALPQMQAWYADARAETYRCDSHEADLLASGTVIEDKRAGA